jgi:hypothetical protein
MEIASRTVLTYGVRKGSQRHTSERKKAMRELLNILSDIKSGALPAVEIPGFIIWILGKFHWLWLPVVVIVIVLWLGR